MKDSHLVSWKCGDSALEQLWVEAWLWPPWTWSCQRCENTQLQVGFREGRRHDLVEPNQPLEIHGAKPTLGCDRACVSWMITGSGALEREPQFVFADPPSCGSLSSLILCPSNWNVVLYQKGLNPNVHWSIIHNRQDMETECMSLHRGMVKMEYVCTVEYYTAVKMK